MWLEIAVVVVALAIGMGAIVVSARTLRTARKSRALAEQALAAALEKRSRAASRNRESGAQR